MMKNRQIPMLCFLLMCLVVLCSCGSGSSTGSKAMEEGKLALAKGDYPAAENYFKLAEDEGVQEDDTPLIHSILTTYNDAKAAFDQKDYETAQNLLETIDIRYQDLSLSNDVNTLKQQAKDTLTASADLEKATQYINTSKYAEGQVVLDSIDQSQLSESQKGDWSRLNTTIATAATAKTETETASPTTVVVIQPPTGYYQPERISQLVPVYTGDYLFPSDSQYISNAYLDLCSKSEVKLIRNEIYARHGYIFQMQEYQDYFSARYWYSPDTAFDVSRLSAVELANVDTIVNYEEQMGW